MVYKYQTFADLLYASYSGLQTSDGSGMGLSSLYGVWEKEKFAEPSIIKSYEHDRTKVMVEFEVDDSELGEKTPEVKEKTPKLKEKHPEVEEKTGVSGHVMAGCGHVKPMSDDVSRDFEVLMGAYRNDFRENARMVLYALAETPEADIPSVAKGLGGCKKRLARHTCDESRWSPCARRRGQGRQVDSQESGVSR